MSNRIACAGSHWKRNITVVCALLIGGNGASGADTVIYGANAYGLANIHEINLSSGQSQWAANLAFETQAIDLDPVTGNVYYFDWTVSANKFAYWNPTTGLSTIVRTYSPTAGVYPKHMAFAPDNTLYVLDNSDLLYTINKLNGDISLVGQVTGLETGSKDRTGDFAFAPDGTFYVATYQSLYRLDLGTLHATLLYSGLLQEIGGFNVWAGLAYCDGVLYAANVRDGPPRSAIFSIDPLTGAVNELFSLPTFVNDLSSCPSSGLLNHPPELAAIGNKTVMEGESIEFGVAALDADGDDLTYTVRDLPPGASFNPETQIFSWVPGTHDIGDHAIDFVVTDNGVPQRSDTEKVIVSVDTLATVESVTITGQTTTEDSSIANLGYASTNFGGSSVNLAVGSFGNGIAARALLKWDLSSIPAGSVIVNAEMSLYSYNDGGNKRIAIKAHRLLRPWVEGTLDGQDRQLDNPDSVCWTESGSGLSWQAGGASGSGDRSLSSITMTTNSGVGRYTWNITSAVQNWVNGNWANDGILLESLNENLANIKYFNASEVQTSSRRPQLIVDYVVAPVANQAPVLDPIGDRTVGEQENLSFAVTASDPDQDNLSFGADVLPAGATLDPTSGAFNWTPSVGQAGSYPILFTVSDDGVPVLSDSEQVTITVTASGPIAVTLSGEAAMEDAMIVNSQYSLFNFGSSPNLYIGAIGGQVARTLIRWNLSSIPAGSTIINAEMSVYSRQSAAGGAITINARRVLKPWIEGATWSADRTQDDPDSMCWVEYGDGIPWDTAGASGPGDRDEAILASSTNLGTGWSTWNITTAVQHWVDGDWTNDGLILMSGNESQSNAKIFVPSEYQDQNLIPVLNIEYILP